MAIATLSKVYNNTGVFKGVVKIRKGLSCKMMISATDMESTSQYFYVFADKMRSKAPSRDPNYKKMLKLIEEVQRVAPFNGILSPSGLENLHQFSWFVVLLCVCYLWLR